MNKSKKQKIRELIEDIRTDDSCTKINPPFVENGEINIASSLVIPAYHPAAFVSSDIQLKAWKKLEVFI